LYSHGFKNEALVVLSRLMNCAEDSQDVLFIKNEMEGALELEKSQPKFSLKGAFKDKSDLKPIRRLVLCFMVQMMQQWTGINVIAFYGEFSALSSYHGPRRRFESLL
jgi:hypothetical protein